MSGVAARGAADAGAHARLRPVRRRLTRVGWATLLVAGAVTAAAVNTANNLLYLLLALMLAALPLSAWLAGRQLAGLRLRLHAPREVFAGDEAVLAASLDADRDAVGIVVSVRLAPTRAVTRAGDRANRRASGSTLAAAVAPAVVAGSEARLVLRFVSERRGPLRLRPRLASLFPFGLIEAARALDEDELELLVLPRPIRSPGLRASDVGEAGETPTRRRGEGDDLLEIREHRPGDAALRIDWKATARLDRSMVREHEEQRRSRATIVLDTTRPPGDDEAGRVAVERAISEAAGAALALRADGRRIRLLAPGTDFDGEAEEVLRVLARLPVHASGEGPPTPSAPPGALVLRAGAPESAEEARPSGSGGGAT